MEEELQGILNNAELDEAGRLEAIKKIIGDNYVPTKKYKDDVSNVKKENKQLKDTIDNQNIEIEGYKTSQLTEEEKIKKELEKAQEATKRANIRENKIEAKDILSDVIEDKEELKNIIDSITTDNLETTKSVATKLAETMKKQKEATEAKVRKELIEDTPKPNGGEGAKSMTKEDFMKLSYTEQVKYKTDNPEGYKQLFKE